MFCWPQEHARLRNMAWLSWFYIIWPLQTLKLGSSYFSNCTGSCGCPLVPEAPGFTVTSDWTGFPCLPLEKPASREELPTGAPSPCMSYVSLFCVPGAFIHIAVVVVRLTCSALFTEHLLRAGLCAGAGVVVVKMRVVFLAFGE